MLAVTAARRRKRLRPSLRTANTPAPTRLEFCGYAACLFAWLLARFGFSNGCMFSGV